MKYGFCTWWSRVPTRVAWVGSLGGTRRPRHLFARSTWLGMLQGEAKWSAFRAAEVFCLPSHQENFGIVVVEALACGKPVSSATR